MAHVNRVYWSSVACSVMRWTSYSATSQPDPLAQVPWQQTPTLFPRPAPSALNSQPLPTNQDFLLLGEKKPSE